jgi:hypothetical protein
MGWNLQTWLWGTVALCAVTGLSADIRLNLLFKKDYSREKLKFEEEIFQDKVQVLNRVKRFCGYLATYCIVTVIIFF